MKKRLIKILIISGLAVSILSGCSKEEVNKQIELEQKIESLEEQNKALEVENEALKNKIIELEQVKIDSEEEQPEANNNQLTLYTVDVDTLDKVVVKEVEVKEELSLQDKLQEISNQLSKESFNGLPIEVQEIKEVDNKKIAIINLKEDKNNEVGWKTVYFQGSTGGAITTKTLVENFLQKEVSSEWIDGVKFLCDGEDISADHIPELQDIIYK